MYTIKSESKEGTYYLCNNWRKNKALWVKKENYLNKMFFKTISGAKRSLTSLLKSMPEYKNDKFSIVNKDFKIIETL